jgi:putative ABC transport system permease protein
MKKLGFGNAADQIIHASSKTGYAIKVIGEVEDFSYQGAQSDIQPLIHFYSENDNLSDWNYISIRSKPGTSLKVIDLIKDLWHKTEPESTASYFFAIDKINALYKGYIRINMIITWFSILAIILSGMGLFALSSFTLSKKTKEIGIRKVNGANIAEVMLMLNKDFIKWVAIAFLLATPVAWLSLHTWLRSFANRTELSWWIFVLAGLYAMAIALITVSWQSWRAARRNPVEALRYE